MRSSFFMPLINKIKIPTSYILIFFLCSLSSQLFCQNNDGLLSWFKDLFTSHESNNESIDNYYFVFKALDLVAKEDVISTQKPISQIFIDKFAPIKEPDAYWLTKVAENLNQKDFISIRNFVCTLNSKAVLIWYENFKKFKANSRDLNNLTLSNSDLSAMQKATLLTIQENSLQSLFPNDTLATINAVIKASNGLKISADPFFYRNKNKEVIAATIIVAKQANSIACNYASMKDLFKASIFKEEMLKKQLSEREFNQASNLYETTYSEQGVDGVCSYAAYVVSGDKDTIKKMLILNKGYNQFKPFSNETLTAFVLENPTGFDEQIKSVLMTLNTQLEEFQKIGWQSSQLNAYNMPIENNIVPKETTDTPFIIK